MPLYIYMHIHGRTSTPFLPHSDPSPLTSWFISVNSFLLCPIYFPLLATLLGFLSLFGFLHQFDFLYLFSSFPLFQMRFRSNSPFPPYDFVSGFPLRFACGDLHELH